MRFGVVLLALLVWPSTVFASVDCGTLAAGMERRLGIPDGLLRAIALAESGRRDVATGQMAAWPWAIASGADFSQFAADKSAAIETVKRLQASGRRNIDVGCMQVNLLHHPEAFSSLEAAFEPRKNVEYGARFLASLQAETGSWDRAVERYHSADPDRGRDYRQRVLERWQGGGSGLDEPRAERRRLPTVYRPRVDKPAKPVTPFAWAVPKWRLAPVRVGESLWTHRPARALDLRRHVTLLPKRTGATSTKTPRS